ncbi:MAG: hypothetical protein U1G07_02345 [Verrucomicrobiota bacterium]
MLTRADEIRRLSAVELEHLGQQSLCDHLVAQAVVAHQKYAPLTADKLEALLHDADVVRHPVRLVFEFGAMALHQFAQPDIDWRNTQLDGRTLYLRPLLRTCPDLLPLAVAYMIPLINYGEVISDAHCLSYGATLLGLVEEDFYNQVCKMSDLVGAEARLASSSPPTLCG